MKLKKQFEKETGIKKPDPGHDFYTIMESRCDIEDYNNKYVRWLEQKLTSDNSDYAVSASPTPKLPPERICHHIQPIQDYAKKLNYTKCPVCGGNFT